MIKAGKLRQYAAIESRSITGTGDRGQPTFAWTALYQSVPMSIVPLSGRTLEITRQLCATATHKILLRYHSQITAEMRVNYQGRYFGIGYVGEGDFRKHDMELLVTELKVGAT